MGAEKGGRTILIATGVGNDRNRRQAPAFDHLHTDFLQRLSNIGVDPADVDVGVNTHIHYDHVGWNTKLDGKSFVPTFPKPGTWCHNATTTTSTPKTPKACGDPARTTGPRLEGIRLVFADSITPLPNLDN